MSVIYFDQRVWIDLLKANEGIEVYSQYTDIYNQVIKTSDSNKHQYPISACHIIETGKRADKKSRNDLLKFILETSKFNSILPRTTILDLEVRNALLASLSIEKVDLKNKIFGKGLDHCFGTKEPIFGLIRDPNIIIDIFDTEFRETAVKKDKENEKKLAQSIEDFREKILDHPDKEKRKDIAEAYEHCNYYVKLLVKEMDKLGLYLEDIEHIFSTKETYKNFWKNAPSIHIFQIMDYARNSNRSRKVKPNDLYDLQCISIASSYCDIVVTEREWANILNQNGVGELYKTKIIHNIKDLETLL